MFSDHDETSPSIAAWFQSKRHLHGKRQSHSLPARVSLKSDLFLSFLLAYSCYD